MFITVCDTFFNAQCALKKVPRTVTKSFLLLIFLLFRESQLVLNLDQFLEAYIGELFRKEIFSYLST